MINFIMVVDGVERINRSFATFGVEISDFSEPFNEIADGLQTDNMLNMISEGMLYGPWPALADSTIKNRIRRGFGSGPMLINTGDLSQSLAGGGGSGAIREITAMSLSVGTSVPYAGYLHYGTKRMPARRIIGLLWNRKIAIVRTLGDYVRRTAREAGLLTDTL